MGRLGKKVYTQEINAKSSFKMQLRHPQPVWSSLKTHFHSFSTEKYRDCLCCVDPLKMTIPARRPPTRNGKEDYRRFLTIRFHKCHPHCWRLKAIEFSVNMRGNGLC